MLVAFVAVMPTVLLVGLLSRAFRAPVAR